MSFQWKDPYDDEQSGGAGWIDPFDEAADPPRADGGDFVAGAQAGWESLKSLMYGAKAAFGQAVGDEDMQQSGIEQMQAHEELASEYGRGRITRYEDVKGVGDFMDYAQYTLGQLTPFALESAATAIAGAAVGTSTAGPVGGVVGGVAGLGAKTAVKEAIKKYVRGEAMEEAEKAVAKNALAKAGGTMGAVIGSYPVAVGDVYNETVEAGDPSAGTAFAAAIPYTALDVIPEVRGIRKVLDGTKGGIISRVAKNAVTQAPMEAAAEAGQEEVLIQTRGALDPDYDTSGEEANSRRLNSAIAGGLGGAAFGGIAGLSRSGDPDPYPTTPPTPPLSTVPVAERAAVAKAAADQAKADAERLMARPLDPYAATVAEQNAARQAEIDAAMPGRSGPEVNPRLRQQTYPGAAPARQPIPAGPGVARPTGLVNSVAQQTAAEAPGAAQPAGALPRLPDDPMVVFRDGTVARKGEIEAEVARLEAAGNQQAAADLRAKVLGYAPQDADTQGSDTQGSDQKPVAYVDPRLKRESYRAWIQQAVDSDMEAGGGMAVVPSRTYKMGESDKPGEVPLIRTPSVNPGWVQSLLADTGLSVDKVRAAVAKALKGERLGVRQAAAVTAILDQISGERAAPQNLDYARAELERARALRRRAKMGVDADPFAPGSMDAAPDWLLDEAEYADEMDGTGRAFLEFHAEAQALGLSDEAEALLDSQRSDDEIAADLADLIARAKDGRASEVGTQEDPREQGQGPRTQEAETRVTPEERRELTADRRQKKRLMPRSQERRQGDRRQDIETRKRVEHMTPDELRQALLTDDLTGLGNRRAYDESEKMPIQVAIDLDGLKFINDTYGHDAGDQFIAEFGAAVQAITGDGYHLSGDEFMVQAINESAAIRIMREIEAAAADIEIAVTITKTGEEATVSGVHFSYGIGQDKAAADKRLYEHKDERKRAGIRKDREPDDGGPVEAPPAAQVQGSAQEEEVDQSPADAGLSDSEPYEFSSSQVALSKADALKVRGAASKLIDKADIDPTDGLEKRPHITVKYGLHTADAADLAPVLAGEGPITATVEGIEIFENNTQDVVVLRVSSADLVRLNQKISDSLEVTDTHPDYKPHITLGYVKKGAGRKYANAKTGLEGKTLTFGTVEFSGKDGNVTPIALEKSTITPDVKTDEQAAPIKNQSRTQAAEKKGESTPTDLFGEAPVKEQSLADAKREKDAKRNGRRDVPMDAPPGTLFNQGQREIEDAQDENEYPFGRVAREDQYFGSRVRVLPALRGDTAWEGMVGSVLNGGRLLEVTKDGADFSVRVSGDRIEVLETVTDEQQQASVQKAPASRPAGRPDPGRYSQPRNTSGVEAQKEMAERGGRIAMLRGLNERAGMVYTADEIDNAARENIDAMRDYLIERARQIPGAAEAIKKFGLPEDTAFFYGERGLAKGKIGAAADGVDSNWHDTADAAAAELARFIESARAGRENRASMDAARKSVADKLRAGERPTFDAWKAAFPQLKKGHTYLRQPDISPFLIEHFGFKANNIKAGLGAAAGTVTSDTGAKYPIVYFNKLADVLGQRSEQATTDDTDAADAWDAMREGDRAALASSIGWVTGKGVLDRTGRKIVNSSWDQLSAAAKNLISQRLSGRQDAQPASAPAEKIEDFGEKIEGARKDTWQSYKKKMDQAYGVDIAGSSLAKSWPEPDYEALINDGADPFVVAFVRSARDEIPPKPRKAWKVRGWAASVEQLRRVSNDLLSGKIDKQRLQDKFDEPQFETLKNSLLGRVELYEKIGHKLSLKGVRVTRAEFGILNGVEYKPPKVVWVVERPADRTAFSSFPEMMASGETRAEAIDNFLKAIEDGKVSAPKATDKKPSFDIYSYRSGEKKGRWFIGKKIGKDYVDLESFEDVKAAREYLAGNADKLAEKLERMKYVPAERNENNAPRVGVDHRNGANVTPAQFQEAFGFRGVQFGNYVENAKRQQDLNEAYDALMDMAGILNVPPRALSLNGELGLAFGARGKGAAGRQGGATPAAHYERGEIVINLTKNKGAGSLAHEWWHSLDNYFSRMRSKGDDYATEALDVSLAAREANFHNDGSIRREMILAFGDVVRAVNKSKLIERSRKLDKTRSKLYWSTGREMTARAFESYIIERLKDQGASNDYLANIVSEDYWEAAAALGLEKDGTYPYPEAAEIPDIRAAFDGFFRVVQTKETDRGVAMYSRMADDAPANPSRRRFVMGAAAVMATFPIAKFHKNDVALGKAQAISETVLRQNVSPAAEKILRGNGATQIDGAKRVRQVLTDIMENGPKEVRQLARKILGLMPEDGLLLTVDDDSLVNAHGVVELEPIPHLTLFTADGRQGLTLGTVLHETLHAAVAARYRTISVGVVRSNDAKLNMAAPAAADALAQFRELWREFHQMTKANPPSKDAAMSVREATADPDEFFVRALTDAPFQRYLAGIEYQGKTLFQRFKDWIKSALFGLRQSGTAPSWLDAALAASDDLIEGMGRDAADFSRMKAIAAFNRRERMQSALYARTEPAEAASPYADLNRRIREEHVTAWDKARTWLKRQLSPGGLLPDAVFREKIKRDSEFEVIEFDVAHLVGQLERAVKADYGTKAGSLDETVQRLLSEVMAGNVAQDVPERTKVVLLGMRQYIDRLSMQYAGQLQAQANQAIAESERLREEQRALSEERNALEDTEENEDTRAELLAEIRSKVARANAKQAEAMARVDSLQTILNNLGEYVNRSYRAFDDKDWARKVPDKVLDDAREYLIGRYTEDGAMDEADAADRAETMLNRILKHDTAYESMEGFIKEAKLGAKDLSILKRRKQIAPQIRALLGEYTDPRITFAKSATKMGRLIWNQTFLDRVLEMGMGQFLWTEDNAPPEATAQIASESSDAYDPLNGLWTTPEINQAFKDELGKEQMADWYRIIVQMNGFVKYGKAQPLTSTVYTPSGPVAMGSLKIGDEVCGANGRTRVTGIFPQGEIETYRIKFSDGSEVEASGEHLWEVNLCGTSKPRILTTDDLRYLPEYRIAKRQVSVPVAAADFDEQPVPVDPYTLGALLGDGSFRSPSTVRFSSVDDEILQAVSNGLPPNHAINHPASWASCDYSIVSKWQRDNHIRLALAKLGLWGKCSKTKFIPDIYKYNSRDVRLGVIRGLLDTDGWVVRDGQPALSVSNERLARDFAYLCTSLGMPCLVTQKKTAGADSFTVKVKCEDASELFSLTRKREKCRIRKKPVHRTIVSIEQIGKQECQCIQVEDERHLYMTDGFVLTHNTVLSPTTAARNWMSAFFFAVANGHFDMRHMAKSVQGLREYFTQNGDAAKLAYLRKLKHLGVVYDTPYAGEMMRLLEDSRVADKLVMGKGRFDFKQGLDLATKFYQYGDDFWKIIGFENEKRQWMKAGLPEAEAEVRAAERVRNTYPTYSMVGRGIQSLRRFPLAGTFVSFPAEIIRTTGNMLRYLAADMKDLQTRPMAMRRAAGLAIASGFAYGLQALSMALLGMDDDDDEAVRRMAAPWQRNSNLIYTGRDADGNIRYLDVSFLDPYNYWKRPIMAITRNQPWEDSARDVAKETLTPFFGTDIAAGAIFEVLANRKESGAPVYNEHDEVLNQTAAIADHLRKNLQPGIASNLERTWKALNGDVSPSGRKYSPTDEAAAWVGFRMSTLDPKVALYYRSFDFKDAKAEADKKIRDVIRKEKKVDSGDLRDAWRLNRRLREKAFREMNLLVSAALKAGMSRKDIMDTLKNSGVSGDDRIAILNGKVPKYRPSERVIKDQAAKARTTFGPDAYRETIRRYREVLSYDAGG